MRIFSSDNVDHGFSGFNSYQTQARYKLIYTDIQAEAYLPPVYYLKQYFLLACFKRNPQDLPASDQLLLMTVAVYFGVGCLHNSMHDTLSRSIQIGIIDLASLFLFTYFILRLLGQMKRWNQTVTALAGAGILLTLIATPVSYGLLQTKETPIYPLFVFAIVFLFSWSLVIQGHVFRHAFSMNFGAAIALAFFYNMMSFMLVSSLMAGNSSV